MLELSQMQKMISEASKDLDGYSTNYFFTLNALTSDVIKHESQVEKFCYWLNCYCYGRAYKRGEILFRIVAVNELGSINQGLHSHLIVAHKNDISRTFDDIDTFTLNKWYRLLNANNYDSKFGSLAHVQFIQKHEVEGYLGYMTKTFNHQSTNLNLQYIA